MNLGKAERSCSGEEGVYPFVFPRTYCTCRSSVSYLLNIHSGEGRGRIACGTLPGNYLAVYQSVLGDQMVLTASPFLEMHGGRVPKETRNEERKRS
jgi:hypothetical protein